ncbi:MAG: peptidase M22 [Opitutae bacterium]|nr:peptidase M22 [Opitutae bacterium]
MPSLNQLLARHGRLLVLDAASAQVQVGLLHASRPAVWHTATAEAGTGLFAGTDAVLRDAATDLADIGAFVFCEGPGSILGIRTVAMAIRSWQTICPRPGPAYHYQSLALLALELARPGSPAPAAVITDARRDTWNCVVIDAHRSASRLQRLSAAATAALPGDLWQPSAFRAWAEPPRAARDCAYDVAALLVAHADADLFAPTDAPDAFQPATPDYKKWSAQIHSSATPAK